MQLVGLLRCTDLYLTPLLTHPKKQGVKRVKCVKYKKARHLNKALGVKGVKYCSNRYLMPHAHI